MSTKRRPHPGQGGVAQTADSRQSSPRHVSLCKPHSSGETRGAWLQPCYRCGEKKPYREFSPDRTKTSGRSSICRPCDREKSREYYLANYVPSVHELQCASCGETF